MITNSSTGAELKNLLSELCSVGEEIDMLLKQGENDRKNELQKLNEKIKAYILKIENLVNSK